VTVNKAATFLVEDAIALRELITEGIQDRVVHPVGAVRVGVIQLRADVGGVVVEAIEHVMALVFVSAEDVQDEGDMGGDGGVGADAVGEAEVSG
jgi:hypothetical protein